MKKCLFLALLMTVQVVQAELLIIGIDNKESWDDDNKLIRQPPGKDLVLIVDIANPLEPKIVASLPIPSDDAGPSTEVAITADESIALAVNPLIWSKEGDVWKRSPDNKLFVIDLKANPIKEIKTLTVGKEPFGIAINKAGNLALVVNNADNTVSVLSIQGKEVNVIDTVAMGDSKPAAKAVAFTPDGKRALVSMTTTNQVAILEIDGQKVTYKKETLPVSVAPFMIDVSPNGKLAIATSNHAFSDDGHSDSATVIDLESKPARVIDYLGTCSRVEGFAISPKGDIAAGGCFNGSMAKKSDWFYRKNGSIFVLKIDGKKVTKIDEIEVGGKPEGVAFSADGKYLYVANLKDSDLSILRVEGTKVTNTGKRFKLPGPPVSIRSRVLY